MQSRKKSDFSTVTAFLITGLLSGGLTFELHRWLPPEIPFSQERLRNTIVRTAVSLRGVPYRFGGDGPAGFDCSGFTRFVYARIGISLPHGSRPQYLQFSKVLHPEPGDMLFYNLDGKLLSHVGIYLDDHNMVHAPRSGKNVELADPGNSYWRQHYAGAVSVLAAD